MVAEGVRRDARARDAGWLDRAPVALLLVLAGFAIASPGSAARASKAICQVQHAPSAKAERRMNFAEEFKLRNGEAAQVGGQGLTLRFDRVPVDGRCPVGDPCVSGPGDAVVQVTVQQPPQPPATLELHTHPKANAEARYLGHSVRLLQLEPRPIGEQQVPLAQYWATFTVSN